MIEFSKYAVLVRSAGYPEMGQMGRWAFPKDRLCNALSQKHISVQASERVP